jgi:hypothetical protein
MVELCIVRGLVEGREMRGTYFCFDFVEEFLHGCNCTWVLRLSNWNCILLHREGDFVV